MANDMMVKELDQVVVRFSGDSGDGMQLAGNIFSTVSATVGNDISTRSEERRVGKECRSRWSPYH